MGSDKDAKELAKIEKKRLKAQVKAEKARAKAAQSADTDEEELSGRPAGTPESRSSGEPKSESKPGVSVDVKTEPSQSNNQSQQPQIIVNIEPEPWYKDPRWISAIIGAISLSLALIAYFTDWL